MIINYTICSKIANFYINNKITRMAGEEYYYGIKHKNFGEKIDSIQTLSAK